jgi:dTDP-4-amino-4,6-dideoxygalactose transaminase/RimJ/RimL family protein N-acetyltransferase
MLFAWRNLPEIVALGKTQATVTLDEHVRWFSDLLASRDHLLLTVHVDGAAAGQIRFDPAGQQASEVSIYLLDGFRGRGVGMQALRRGCAQAFGVLASDRIVATVRADNPKSQSFFVRAGFREESRDGAFSRYSLSKPATVPHNRLTFDEHEVTAVAEAVRSGQWASGIRVASLEDQLARRAGAAHAVCVSSGLSALRLALLAVGVQPGDRVLVPAYSCVALANAVIACGAVPVPVDVDGDTWQLDTASAEWTIAEQKPAAAIVVNMFGAAAPVDRMHRWRIPIIEDCAHAFGFASGGRILGSRTDLSILSLHATKLLGAGEGGAVLSNTPAIADYVRSSRDYADRPADGRRQNDQMTDIEAALASAQLARLDDMLSARRRLAHRYTELLRESAHGSESFRLPTASPDHAWYRFTIELTVTTARTVVEKLARLGVNAAEPVDNWIGDSSAFPIAHRAFRHLLSLPLYPTLTNAEQDRVVDALLQACDASDSPMIQRA